MITSTLSTQNFTYPPETLIYPYYSYSNNESVKAAALWHVYDVLPNELKVTENFIQDIYPYKWTQTKIPIMVTYKFNPEGLSVYNFGSGVSSTDVFGYPPTNPIGALYPITIALSGINAQYYTVDDHQFAKLNAITLVTSLTGIELHDYIITINDDYVEFISESSAEDVQLQSQLYARAFDDNGAIASGYVFTALTSLCSISSAIITARTKVNIEQQFTTGFNFPVGLPTSYVAYISHPFENNINEIQVNTFSSDCLYAQKIKDQGLLLEGKISTLNVPAVTTSNTNNLALSGASGVYAITYNPVKKLLYAADSDSNKVYLYNEAKTITQTLYLSTAISQLFGSVPSLSARLSEIPISPSSLSIDKEHNVWVALYDSSLVLKYNTDLTTRMASAAPMSSLTDLFSAIDSQQAPYHTPSTVKVDQTNNVWACYSHPLSGSLIKYDTNGNQELYIKFETPNTVPVDLAINKENEVWTACHEGNKVLCYNGYTGSLISERSFEVLKPSYLAVDKGNNLWVLHGYNLITKFDPLAGQASTWKVKNTPGFEYTLIRNRLINLSEYPIEEIQEAYEKDEIWGGVAVDLLNRVWAVNSETNTALLIPATEPSRMKLVSLIPKADTNYYIRSIDDNYVQSVSTPYVRSAQAVGDWTGNEWYQKFGSDIQDKLVMGYSTNFRIYDLYQDAPAVAKVNEDFSGASYFKSLALPELLQENTRLFDDFFVSLVGSGSLTSEELGRVFYEKIANFNLNHSDINTTEIAQFLSLLSSVKLEAETFGVDFPVEIERLINIFSVPLHNLRGQPVYNTTVVENIGDILTQSSLITAGQYLYVKDKRYDTYQIVEVGQQDITNQNVYPLSSISIDGLRIQQDPIELFKNYHFFEYNPYNVIGYQSNIIDWENPYTTATYANSSWNFYYEDDGFLDLYFNNLLTKRLFDK